MAVFRNYKDLKYEETNLSITEFLKTKDLPAIVSVRTVESETHQTKQLERRSILFQKVTKKPFAHIKVLRFYDNKKKESEMGAEYVLEHETFVRNEYLMPLKYPGQVRYVRRPESRGRYMTIKQVIGDCPAFVKAETDTETHLSSDITQPVTLPAKTILELKRVYTNEDDEKLLLDCSDGDKLYTFYENDDVNFTVYERKELYSLAELSNATLLPKVILFEEIDSEDVILKESEFRSGLLTMVEGPLEVLGFTDVKYLICGIRNKRRKTYETLLIPEKMWNKIYVQQRCFTGEKEKEIYIKRKYRQCLSLDFLGKSLFIFPVHQRDVTWLRSPDLFKRNLNDANKLYEVVELPFEDSSDEDDDDADDGDEGDDDTASQDHIYSDIAEPPPPLPPKVPITTPRQHSATKKAEIVLQGVKTWLTSVKNTVADRIVKRSEHVPDRPPKPQLPSKSETLPREKIPTNVQDRPLSFSEADTDGYERHFQDDKKYTKLDFRKSARVYDTPICLDSSQDNTQGSTEMEGLPTEIKSNKLEVNVLKENQSENDFFKYSVEEVSFCFEHCGLKDFAEYCSQQKLDGPFFQGFTDWNLFSLSRFDVAVINKVIYHGWRPKTEESSYAV